MFDPEKGSGGYRPRAEGGVLSYNEFWYERGIELVIETAQFRPTLPVLAGPARLEHSPIGP